MEPSFNSDKRPLFAFGVENCSAFSSPLREGAGESMLVGRTFKLGVSNGVQGNPLGREAKKTSDSRSTSDTQLTAALNFQRMADALCQHSVNLNSARRRKKSRRRQHNHTQNANTTKNAKVVQAPAQPNTERKRNQERTKTQTSTDAAGRKKHNRKTQDSNNQNRTAPHTTHTSGKSKKHAQSSTSNFAQVAQTPPPLPAPAARMNVPSNILRSSASQPATPFTRHRLHQSSQQHDESEIL